LTLYNRIDAFSAMNDGRIGDCVTKLHSTQSSPPLTLYRNYHRPTSLTLDLHSISAVTLSVPLKGDLKFDAFALGSKFPILKRPNLTVEAPPNLPTNSEWWNVYAKSDTENNSNRFVIPISTISGVSFVLRFGLCAVSLFQTAGATKTKI
jgi:hypothetical protein